MLFETSDRVRREEQHQRTNEKGKPLNFSERDIPTIETQRGDFPRTISPWAISALVSGVFTILLPVLGIVITGILAVVAIISINKSQGQKKGKGLAITGLVLSVVCTALVVGAFWFVRAKARENLSANNMRQIGLAFANYDSAFMQFPSDIVDRETGKPLLSWRVAILPYLEQGNLHDQFNMNEPWDSPTNLAAAKLMPDIFNRPGAGTKAGFTVYQIPVGNGAAFSDSSQGPISPTTMRRFRDGSSHTVILVETNSDASVFWTKPADYVYDPTDPKKNLGLSNFGILRFTLGDTSILQLDQKMVTKEQLNRLLEIADGEIVGDLPLIKK
jgi:type II secretory pathway pseudopilin PulG